MHKNWLIFTLMATGYAATILDTTIVHIALPTLSTQLHVSLSDAGYVAHVYNLSFAAMLLVTGKLADHYGHRRVFLVGLSLFLFSSLACSLSRSLPQLLVFRATQAIGGSALGSVGFAMVSRIYPPQRPTQRARALNLWSAIAALSAILGPIVGGFLIPFGWNTLFLVHVPLCCVALVLACIVLPSFPATPQRFDLPRTLLFSVPATPQYFDLPGTVFFSLVLTGFSLLCLEAGEWALSLLLLILFATLFCLVGLIVRERRVIVPFLDFHLFRLRSFTTATSGMWLFWSAYQGATIVLSLYFLSGRGFSPDLTALLLLPVPAANLLVSLLLGPHLSPTKRGILGVIGGSIGFSWLALLKPDVAWFVTILPTGIIGASAALCFTAFHNLALSEIPTNRMGQASSIFNLARQLGTTLGTIFLLSSIHELTILFHASVSAYSGTWGIALLLVLIVFPLLLLKRSPLSSRVQKESNHENSLHNSYVSTRT